MNNTLPLTDVLKLEGVDIDQYILANSNLLLVKENLDKSKNLIQFNLKRQVLDKINDINAKLGTLENLDTNEEISPEEVTICSLVENNQKNIADIFNIICSTEDDLKGTGIQGKIISLEDDVNILKNTHFLQGRQIELISSKDDYIKTFTLGEIVTCNLNSIPGLNIATNINNFSSYSYDLEISLLAKMENTSLDSKINQKYAVVNTIFNLNSLYFSSDNKLGIINLPFGDSIFVKFDISAQTIIFENVFMTNMSNYNRNDIKINNAILRINKLESAVI